MFVCSIPLQVFTGAIRGSSARESHKKYIEDTEQMKVQYKLIQCRLVVELQKYQFHFTHKLMVFS